MNQQYENTDLVYVNPALRTIVSKVKFDKDGNVVPLEITEEKSNEKNADVKKRRVGKKRFYPWGTYATVRKLYRIEGKQKETEDYIQLDEAIGKAIEQPYW